MVEGSKVPTYLLFSTKGGSVHAGKTFREPMVSKFVVNLSTLEYLKRGVIGRSQLIKQ